MSMDKEFSLYIRRCHVCDALNEDAGSVVESSEEALGVVNVPSQPPIKCGQCGKFLAPFIFSDPELIKNQLDNQAKGIPPTEPQDLYRVHNAIYPPLIGLAIYW